MEEDIEDENIKILETQIQACKECKFATCEQCEISYTEVKAIQNLIARYKELEEKVKTLKSLSNDYNRLWIEKCEEYNSLERKIEKINELNIPVETLITEFNRLEDLEDDREQLKEQIKTNEDYIKELQKKLTNAIEIKYIHQDYIPKSKVKEKIDEYNAREKKELNGLKGQDRYFVKQIYQYIKQVLQELLEEG